MMRFRQIDKALTDLLIANENGRYHVETSQRRSFNAEYVAAHPIVSVFYEQGQFSKAAGGPLIAQHDMTFKIEVLVAAPATADLTVLDNPGASAQAIMAAVAASTSAAVNADDLIDEVLDYIYQVIRDPDNYDLGLPVGTVSNPWVGSFTKSSPVPRGEYVVVMVAWSYTCRAAEITAGATPVPVVVIDTSIEETADQSGSQYDSALQGAEVQ